MSVAMEYAPAVSIPAQPWDIEPWPAPLASVSVLHPPADPAPVGWRLTRRGVVVVAAVVLALGLGLIWLARASAPRVAPAASVPRVVTVAPGDTLWSIAGRVAPGTDPRAEVAALQRRNGLTGVELVPGQVLRVP